MQTTCNFQRSPIPSRVTLGCTQMSFAAEIHSKASCWCLWSPCCSLALSLAVSMWIFCQVWKWNLQFRESSQKVWAPLSCKVLTESWLENNLTMVLQTLAQVDELHQHLPRKPEMSSDSWRIPLKCNLKFKLWGQWDCNEILQVSNPRANLMSLGSLFSWGKVGTVLYAIYFDKRKAAETLQLFSSVSTAPIHFWNLHFLLVLAAGTFNMLKCLYMLYTHDCEQTHIVYAHHVYILQTNTSELSKLTLSVSSKLDKQVLLPKEVPAKTLTQMVEGSTYH